MTAQTQPPALKLADKIVAEYPLSSVTVEDAAAELRRLQDEVEQLREAINIPTIEKGSQDWLSTDPAIAWHLIFRHADNWADIGQMMQEYIDAQKQSAVERLEASIAELERQLAARAPLSDERMHELMQEHAFCIGPMTAAFGRSVERAHGIGDPA